MQPVARVNLNFVKSNNDNFNIKTGISIAPLEYDGEISVGLLERFYP